MANDWISTTEATELSGYHPEYIRQLIRQGEIQANRKGTMYWIDRGSLLSYLQKAKKTKATDRRYGPHKK